MTQLTLNNIREEVRKNLVKERQHPDYPHLSIFNYTPECQYGFKWNSVNIHCRGIIFDTLTEQIVARSWPKFFNLNEIPLPHDIAAINCYDKLDGSLGIIYKTGDGFKVATRGSFVSEQALYATNILHTRYSDFDQPDNVTTLVEIIYPDNRIVVDYKGYDDLVLIGSVNVDGTDHLMPEAVGWWDGPVVDNFTVNTIDDCIDVAAKCDEGVVICCSDSAGEIIRFKVKNSDYINLHRLITMFSPHLVWRSLASGEKMSELLDGIPDELYDEIRLTEAELIASYKMIEQEALRLLGHVEFMDRKDAAKYIQPSEVKAVVFKMLDNREYAPLIWNLIKPKGIN